VKEPGALMKFHHLSQNTETQHGAVVILFIASGGSKLAPRLGIWGSNSDDFKWHWFSPANHHSTIAPYSSILPPPPSCATAMTRQHSITSSVFKLAASSLLQHLAGHWT
jgi:hypothetical protein